MLIAGNATTYADALRLSRDLLRAYKALEAQAYPSALEASLAVARKLAGDVPLSPTIIRASTFAAKLAAAETQGELTTALRSSAAPAGSYRTKRVDEGRQFALTAYLGGSAAWERPSLNTPSHGLEDFWSFGLSAPVGLEYAWGAEGHATSVLVSLVDLGTVVRYHTGQRITAVRDGTEEPAELAEQPEVGLAQIFSPGLYVVRSGIGLGPVALGLGVSGTRELWPVLFGDGESERAKTLRVSFFLGLDMPLLSF